jgi:hypothetical protein
MPDYSDDEHSGNVTPRKPTKGDYMSARRSRDGMGLPCRLWLLGYRKKMAPAEWRRACHSGGLEK